MEITPTTIKSLDTKQLLEFYNDHAERPIKKFEDRKSGEAKVLALVAKAVVPAPKSKTATPPTPQEKPKKDGKRAVAESYKIKVVIDSNPRKKGCLGYDKLNIIMAYDGKTVGEYKTEEGKHPRLDVKKRWTLAALRSASKKGWVRIICENRL